MFFYYLFSIIIAISYFSIILSFSIGWDKIKVFRKGSPSPSFFLISLIVAFRNEETKLAFFIDSILKQTLEKKFFELILVNDHSCDKSEEIVRRKISGLSNFQIVKSGDTEGKKNAIKFGIEQSKGNLILTTDADCTHHPLWLETIFLFYHANKPNLIIGPVLMTGKTHFEHVQCLDFMSLVASGAGAAGINKPIMCNGANLAFERKIVDIMVDPFFEKIKSGDDIFLLHHLKKIKGAKILFVKSIEATAYTEAEHSFKNFYKQRVRWASKSKYYFDKDTISTAIIVFLMNLSLFGNLVLSLFSASFIGLFFIQFVIKLIPDFILLRKCTTFFQVKKLLWYFLPTQVANIILIPTEGIAGLFVKPRWKTKKKSCNDL
jgi:cellulose synthase/poly-beta-1,6-N-acetylglucosamine synthase-like glycosyltransferase